MNNESTSQGKISINLKPKKIIGPRPIKAPSDYANLIIQAGYVELDPTTIAQEGLNQYLPEGFSGELLTSALNLWRSGVPGKYLEQKFDRSPVIQGLSEGQRRSVYGLAYLVRIFEEAAPEESVVLQEIYAPEITIQEAPTEVRIPARNQFLFNLGEDTIQPIIREVVGTGVDFAKQKIKDFAVGAIKEGGKKLAKEAAKKVVSVATKAGVTAAAQVAGTAIPVIGNILAFIGTKVLPLIGKAFSKIGEWITGERDRRKQLFFIAGALSFVFLGFGLVIPAAAAGLVSIGAGASALGGRAIGSGASGFVESAIYGITHVVVPAIGVPAIIAIIATPVIVALILFIINTGAYVTPYAPALWTPGIVESAYIRVEKKADKEEIKNSELPEEVTYKITVTAKKGTLSNITFENDCKVIKEKSTSSCTAPEPPPPSIISPVGPFTFTYKNTYSSSARDSLIIDTFTVTADVQGEVTGEQAASSASVCIGDCPQDCPRLWPTKTGYITQGAYSAPCCSHHGQEAIDIGSWGTPIPVSAGHAGIIRVRYSSCLGNYIEIVSTCEGKPFFSQYAHLEGVSVSTGQAVSMGQEIGLSGNTGTCTTGLHLHYRFRYSDMSNPSYPNNPPFMMQPYIPKNVTRGCCNDQCSALLCTETIP